MTDLPSVESSPADWEFMILNPSLRMTIDDASLQRSAVHPMGKSLYQIDDAFLRFCESVFLEGNLTQTQESQILEVRKQIEIAKCRYSGLVATTLETPNNTKEI